jgi:Tfp pilus assembly protein PilO
MTRIRWWIVGATLIIVLVMLAGFSLWISPKLDELGVARTTRSAALAQNEVYELQLEALQRQFDGLESVQAELALLREAIPSGAALPAFIGQLDALAERASVTVTEFSSADAMPYVPVIPLPDTGVSLSTTGAADAAAAPTAPPSPLVTAENFAAVPVTISVTGSIDAVLGFLAGLQNGQRLITVTSFGTGAPSAETSSADAAGRVTGQIAGIVYVLLDDN